jgi:hypothetical protein
MSNLSDLLQAVLGKHYEAVSGTFDILGGAIGLVADASAVYGVIESIISSDASLQDVLNAITADFNQIGAILSASDRLQRMRDVDQGINPAVTVFQSLPAILSSVPPVTQDYKLAQIQTCVQAVLFFNYDDKWQVVQADSPYYSDDWSGTLAAPADSSGLAFNYIYTLPQFLRAIYILLTTVAALDPSSLSEYADTLTIALARLTTVHDTVVSSGIVGTKMPGIQDIGQIQVFNETSSYDAVFNGPNWHDAVLGDYPFGAVEVYSAANNVTSYRSLFNYHGVDLMTLTTTQANNFLKLVQLNIARQKKALYVGIGFPLVWQAINQLQSVLGQPSSIDPALLSSWSPTEAQSILGLTLPSPAGQPPEPWWEEPYGLEAALQDFLLTTPPYAAFRIYGGSNPNVPNYDPSTGTVPAPGTGLHWDNLYQYLTWSPWAAQHAFVFVDGSDGNLWLNWSDGTDWYWTNQGAPQAGVAVTVGVGVITVMDSLASAQRPYACVIGTDGQLWFNWWDYTRWDWAAQSTPQSGVAVTAGVGALSVMDTPTAAQRPYVFVLGSDRQLWLNWWDNTAWHWASQGVPAVGVTITSTVGVMTVMDSPDSAQRPYVFLIGSDGQLWVDWWDYDHFVWANQGVPQAGVTVAAGVGVLTVTDSSTSAQLPYIFVIGSDRQLWLNSWDGIAWHWTALGTPGPGITIAFAVGVSTQTPAAFAVGSDGQLWWTYFDQGNGVWDWETHGTPQSGVSIATTIGVQTVMDSEHSVPNLYVLVKGSDGQIWLRRSYGAGWSWLAQGVPLSAGIGGGVGITAKWWSGSPFRGEVGESGPIVPPGNPPGAVTVSASALEFPTQQIGTTGAQQALTVTGNAQLAITAIAILDSAGAASADFVSVPPPGSPPPAGSINIQNGQLVITVWFTPTAAGTRNATLQISHNQPGSPLTVQLSGMGNPKPLPLLSFSPAFLNFNPKKITNHTVTLGNTGTAPLTIESIVIADSNYSMTNACNIGAGGGTLQPGQQCTINVVCRFTGPGGSSDMVITHDAAGSPSVVELNATAKAGGGGQ